MNRAVLLCLICLAHVEAISAQSLEFTMRPTQVNDTSRQLIECQLTAERTIRQQNQLVDSSKQWLTRKQQRTLTIIEVEDGIPVRARLRYENSSTEILGASSQTMKIVQPIANKTYLVTRRNAQLSFSDETGGEITQEEDKLLRNQMAVFGKPNPLATFLNGKNITIGQSMVVPDAVARELLGLTGKSGKTDKLSLKLVGAKNIDGSVCGLFETLLRTSSQESSMSMLLKGQLAVEAGTCRTRSIQFEGPVAISETRGPALGRFVVSTNGNLQVAVQTSFAGNSQLPRLKTARLNQPQRP